MDNLMEKLYLSLDIARRLLVFISLSLFAVAIWYLILSHIIWRI